MASKNVNEMDAKVLVKQEPCLAETPSESEATDGSDMKNGTPSFASVFIPDMQEDYHEIHPKIEIKEEPGSLETDELKSESEEILTGDLEDNQRDEFILPEPTRLNTEAVWNCEFGVTSAGLDKDCLKLMENSSPCHEKSINTAQEDESKDTSHMNGKMSRTCKHCGKYFYHESQLEIHIIIHEGLRTHKCNICGKIFFLSSRLKRHNLIHERTTKQKCNICDKSFVNRSHLKYHILAHEGNKFKCDECDKSFAYPSQLKSHKLFHAGLYKCVICKKSFQTPSCLKRHKCIP